MVFRKAFHVITWWISKKKKTHHLFVLSPLPCLEQSISRVTTTSCLSDFQLLTRSCPPLHCLSETLSCTQTRYHLCSSLLFLFLSACLLPFFVSFVALFSHYLYLLLFLQVSSLSFSVSLARFVCLSSFAACSLTYNLRYILDAVFCQSRIYTWHEQVCVLVVLRRINFLSLSFKWLFYAVLYREVKNTWGRMESLH